MKAIKFSMSTEEVLSNVPSLALLKFMQDAKVNKVFTEEGEFLIHAVRVNDKATCLNHKTMEIFFTTGYTDDKGNNTMEYYTFAFEFNGTSVCNFKGLEIFEIGVPVMYFKIYSQDKIYS